MDHHIIKDFVTKSKKFRFVYISTCIGQVEYLELDAERTTEQLTNKGRLDK